MFRIIKRIVYALCLLYTINIIIYNYGIIIPINIFTIIIVSFADIFGIMGILIIMYLI